MSDTQPKSVFERGKNGSGLAPAWRTIQSTYNSKTLRKFYDLTNLGVLSIRELGKTCSNRADVRAPRLSEM